MRLHMLVEALTAKDKAKPCEIVVIAKCGEHATIKKKETGSLSEFTYHSVYPFYQQHEVVGYLNTESHTCITIKKA